MSFDITIEKLALKYIKKQDSPSIKRLMAAIDLIAADPSIGAPLTNHTAMYKYRVGSYRILYDVYETELVVCIVKVGSPGDVYYN
jgi:mRNA interferase RelE/StbE